MESTHVEHGIELLELGWQSGDRNVVELVDFARVASVVLELAGKG